MKKRIFLQLQIIRAVAALLVVIDHSLSASFPNSLNLKYFGWCCGDIGVAIFFVILVHVSADEFGKPGAATRFALRRIERVVPLYWIATIFEVLKNTLGQGESSADVTVRNIFASLLFLPYVNDTGLFRPVHGVGWTLNYEMFFYIIFALCLLLEQRKLSVLMCGAILFAFVTFGASFHEGLWSHEPQNLLSFYSYPIVLLFTAGMCVRLWMKEGSNDISIKHSALVALTIPAATIIAFSSFVQTYPVSIIWRFGVWTACVVAVIATVRLDGAIAPKDAISKGLGFLGNASYSTYLFHTFALSAVLIFCGELHVFGWPEFILCVLAAHVTGSLAHLFIERPILRMFAGGSGHSMISRPQQST